MQLKIKYFGMLAEVTNCHEERISFSGGTVSDVLRILFKKHPMLEKKHYKVAQNHEIVSNDVEVSTTEIVLLPPFSGG